MSVLAKYEAAIEAIARLIPKNASAQEVQEITTSLLWDALGHADRCPSCCAREGARHDKHCAIHN